MTRLPICSGETAVRAFERAGWIQARQRGSHVSLIKPGAAVVLTVPLHRELDRGLLRHLIRTKALSLRALRGNLLLSSPTGRRADCA